MSTQRCAHCHAELALGTSPCTSCGNDPLLDGRYRLCRELGRGAFGQTWLAERTSDGLQVAIKELLVRRLDDFKSYDLFHREAEVLRTLSHPGIPSYHDDFQVGQGRQLGLYLVTDFVDGDTLADELSNHRYTRDEVLQILRELLLIVAYLHTLSPPVVHRDIKPSNVMRRREDRRLVLIDFGAVKEAARDAEAGSTIAGTFGYMPPEQLAGRTLPASDIYALGVLALELLTRKAPQALLDEQNRLQWEGHLEPGPLRDLLEDMLAPEVSRRESDAMVLIGRVDDLLAGRARARVEPGVAGGGGFRRGEGGSQPFALDAVPSSLRGIMGQMLERLGQDGVVAFTAPGRAEPPPPSPRPAGFGLGGKLEPVASFFRLFGLLFGGIPFVVGIGLLTSEVPKADLGMLFIPLLFSLIGLPMFVVGFLKVRRAKHLWIHGRAVRAEVLESHLDRSLKVNGRSPHKIRFRYRVDDGRELEATASRFDYANDLRMPGAEVWALYDPRRPDRPVLYPLR